MPSWITLMDLNFTAQANQAIANGANTIGGKAFTAANIGTTTVNVINGTGLRWVTDAVTIQRWATLSPTCAYLTIGIADISSDFDRTKEHIFQWYISTNWLTSQNAFQAAYCSIDTAANIVATQMSCEYLGGGNNWTITTATASSSSGTWPIGNIVTIHRKADSLAQYGYATWGGASSRWKSTKDITIMGTAQQSASVLAPTLNKGLAFGAFRGSGGAFTLDVYAMRVLQRW